jgi:diaminohydroxyphosphoribosylaminopyrimidine deaminase/5-amino-6-(5-phosphoribosylamino)uracil reductase
VVTLTSEDYMARALFHAARGRGRTSPNPLVGAVVVSAEGVVVGQGFHERAGDAHAEVRALDDAGARAKGSTLYCTLEPCSHVGRTGPCAVRVVEAGIARVVAAVEDPDPRVRGQGFRFLRAHNVQVEVGIGESLARSLNQPYFTLLEKRRPFVLLKAAISTDGCIAAGPGQRIYLTSEAANRHAQRVRAEVDAIGVGVGTVLADDPLLTARGAYRARPLVRVVFDRSLRMPAAARLLSTRDAGPVIIVTSAAGAAHAAARESLAARGAEIVVAPDPTLLGALTCLGERGVGSLLLEGGAAIHQAAWDEGVVDFVRMYVTPHTIGISGVRFLNGTPFSSSDLVNARTERLGPDVLIEGYVHGSR